MAAKHDVIGVASKFYGALCQLIGRAVREAVFVTHTLNIAANPIQRLVNVQDTEVL